MKANFGKDSKGKTTSKSELFTGGYERMLKERKNKLPQLESAVQEVLDEWSGETICIIKIHEDENGDPSGQHIFIGGVSKISGQIALGKALSEASYNIRDKLIEVAKEDPGSAKAILGEMLEYLAKDLKEL